MAQARRRAPAGGLTRAQAIAAHRHPGRHLRSDLAAKPQLVAANKIDAAGEDGEPGVRALERRAHALKLPFFRISAATGAGVPDLLEAMWRKLAGARQPAA